TEIAVAGIPEPVPVVMEPVTGEVVHGRRTSPKVVVDAGGHWLFGRAADRVAPLIAETAGKINIADHAIVHLLDAFAHGIGGADLAALLDDAVVLASRGDDLLRLKHVMGAGL